ncbi:hypothetical protein [Siphonobacter curvatus]|uniref:Uncharacterized protein n=1 Tax=Siphonobacter curvatus TaxID=2094562 RepID=A0A2S7II93_9BACT|nr:hypothetical protein [Siphonobacter curvatus]PQA55665.1 hypothetical protein C5O19_19840 [Siphonobacter curvatus]
MHYYEWNNIIGNYLFNRNKAGLPIYIALNKDQIINLGIQNTDLSRNEVWQDFVRAIQSQGGRNSSLIEKIETTLGSGSWESRDPVTRKLIKSNYPPCLTLLVTSVLPLTEETFDFSINGNNYHDRANKFFAQHSLPYVQRQDKRMNWNKAWENLSDWALRIKQGEMGIFDSKNFASNYYIYVGKAFSQCLIQPRLFQQLPKLFEKAELIPDQILSSSVIKELLIKYGNELALSDKTKELISIDKDELGQFIRGTIQQNQENWNGESNLDSATSGWTIGGLRLTFKDPQHTNFILKLNYRFKSKANLDYPESLRFEVPGQEEVSCQEVTDGWSNEMFIPFNQDGYSLSSPANRWKARTVKRSHRVWLFTRGNSVGLNGNTWIETDVIARNQSEMYLLYDRAHLSKDKVKFELWKKHFSEGLFKEVTERELDGIPHGYSLFKFSRASQPLSWLSHLTFPIDKRIELVGGLKLSYGVYYALELPKVTIIGETGQEKLQALLENERTINLHRHEPENTVFCFPNDFPLDVRFQLQIVDEAVKTTISYCFAESITLSTDKDDLPCWNKMGELCKKNNADKYEQGLLTTGVEYAYQESYLWNFLPGYAVSASKPAYLINSSDKPFDELLNYLSARKESSIQQFSTAFELFSSKRFHGDDGLSTGQYKRRSLEMMRALGHIEYDDVHNKIWINSSRLIPLPARRGRRALLTGFRSNELIALLREVADQFNVSISVENHPSRYQNYLLPSAIILIADGPAESLCGQKAIEQVAAQLNIPYDISNLPQFGLLSLSASLSEYELQILATPEDATLMSYCAYPFKIETLNFSGEVSTFDPEFALVEYKLKKWDRRVYLWKEGQSYRVDRRWSSYYYLHKLNRHVVQVDAQTGDLLIPFSLPLPQHFARAFTLMSGKAPDVIRRTDIHSSKSIKYNRYEHSGNLLANNFLTRLGQ